MNPARMKGHSGRLLGAPSWCFDTEVQGHLGCTAVSPGLEWTFGLGTVCGDYTA